MTEIEYGCVMLVFGIAIGLWIAWVAYLFLARSTGETESENHFGNKTKVNDGALLPYSSLSSL